MPRNEMSSSGAAEDLIRAFQQMGCAEVHLKTLYEKTIAEMENGLVDMTDADVQQMMIEKLTDYREDLIQCANLRRRMMVSCFEMFSGGDKDVWCMVKHLAVSAYCAWEVWQASDDDPELLDIAVEANKMLTKYITRFLGMEVTSCASCLSDYLKGKD